MVIDPLNHISTNSTQWSSCRVFTQMLGPFEETVFKKSKEVFFIPNFLTATLDDELFGTRSKSNPCKMLSSKKACHEGHCSDVITENHFSIPLRISFRRRGEKQMTTVYKLIQAFMNGRGEKSMRGMRITADRGYRSVFLGTVFAYFGVSSSFVIPQHLKRCHPFVGLSFLKMSGREREDFAKDSDEDSEIEEDHMVNESAAWSDDEISEKKIPSLPDESQIETESSGKSHKNKDKAIFIL